MLTVIRLHAECKNHNSALPVFGLLPFETVIDTIQVGQVYTMVISIPRVGVEIFLKSGW